MENAVKNSGFIREDVVEYLTPNSIRKVVRRPKIELDAEATRIPFGSGSLALQTWGDGPTILLVHGWAANQTDMFSFVPEIVTRGYRAATVDLPAHGESTGEYVGLEELGRGVLAAGKILGHLKGVIAHSVGGAATQLALVNGLDAERVVLLASPEDYELGAHLFAKSKNYTEEQKLHMFEIFKDLDVNIHIKSVDFVSDIVVPALIVHSKDDPVVPFSTGQNLARYWRESQFLELDGLKHRGILKDPQIIDKAITYLTK